MNALRAANRALWGSNGLLGAALLVFAWNYLIAPTKVDRLAGVDPRLAHPSPPPAAPASSSDDALIHLPNPMRPAAGPLPPPPFQATLQGTLPVSGSGKGVAFIRSSSRQTETIARVGEVILHHGRPAAEFRGWQLSEVGKEFAVFTNREGERSVLEIGAVAGEHRSLSRTGEAYHPEMYRSRRLASTDSREIWVIDENEIEWMAQNGASLLDREVRISPSADGGLRLDDVDPGSIAAARGLKPGDILRAVNGRPLQSIGDLQSMLSRPPSGVLQLTLERAGKPVAIEYRALPR